MTKKEILLKQRNAGNAPLTDYINTDGYVWKMIENAMEEYHQSKLKLLGIANVVGQSEQLGNCNFCNNKAIIKDEDGFEFCSKCL